MIEPKDKRKDEVKIVSVKQIEKQLKKVDEMRIKPNQKCFQLDHSTGEITIAKMEVIYNPFGTGKTIDVFAGCSVGEPKIQQKVIQLPNCSYEVALNKKNAIKKFNK